jgi:hypothetical protein
MKTRKTFFSSFCMKLKMLHFSVGNTSFCYLYVCKVRTNNFEHTIFSRIAILFKYIRSDPNNIPSKTGLFNSLNRSSRTSTFTVKLQYLQSNCYKGKSWLTSGCLRGYMWPTGPSVLAFTGYFNIVSKI